jgi:hypothetical protein
MEGLQPCGHYGRAAPALHCKCQTFKIKYNSCCDLLNYETLMFDIYAF